MHCKLCPTTYVQTCYQYLFNLEKDETMSDMAMMMFHDWVLC